MKILANTEIPEQIQITLEEHGFQIKKLRIAYEQLENYTKNNEIDILLMQSSEMFDKVLIDSLSHLKVLVFTGQFVELDLIDYAKRKGIKVIWAEESVSNATAELVIAHLLNGCRLLPESNRNMPLEGDTRFKFLQESYKNGIELSGKTLGIVGMNSAGLKVAQKALGLGMYVVYSDLNNSEINQEITLPNGISFPLRLKSVSFDELLEQSHFITVHTSFFEKYLIDKDAFGKAKQLIGVVNCAYPEAVKEIDLLDKINEERLLFAGLDRFEEEPHPAIQVLMEPSLSLSPNINTATQENLLLIWDEILVKILNSIK